MREAIEGARKHLIWVLASFGLVVVVAVLAPGIVRHQRTSPSPTVLELPSASDDSAVTPSNAAMRNELAGDEPGASEPLQYAALPSSAPASGGSDQVPAALEPGGAGDAGSSSLACIIKPSGVVEIGSAVTGIIEKIHVERADLVEQGQVLVEVESEVEKAAVELARARASMDEGVESGKTRLELGKRRSSRVQQLFESDALSLDMREESETETELARLELERARAEERIAKLALRQSKAVLERRTIRSPISGVVVERSMSPGERVDEEPILKVAQIDPLRVEVILPSAMFGSIERGARATVIPEIPGDTVHVANVAIVDRLVDAASGTFGVRLELPNPDHAIPGGVHCQIRFLKE